MPDVEYRGPWMKLHGLPWGSCTNKQAESYGEAG